MDSYDSFYQNTLRFANMVIKFLMYIMFEKYIYFNTPSKSGNYFS